MSKTSPEKVRYGVIGLGHIAQVAVLPAFLHAQKEVELSALISGDPKKLKSLGKKYGVNSLYSYEQFDQCLDSGEIEALYVALPNQLHASYAERALRKGIHVLCEKPLAVSEEECRRMMKAAEKGGAKLMTAYRLHFNQANLKAIETARGRLGNLRYFNSSFSFQLRDKDNIRLEDKRGTGPLWDIGIYCVNAARYFFRDEPLEVSGLSVAGDSPRFEHQPECLAVTMRFPGERLASFVCSFGAGECASYEVAGTKGMLKLESAYEYTTPMKMELNIGGKKTSKTFPKSDQFAPELIYFADCIRRDVTPEPSGLEGLADVRILIAIEESIRRGKAVSLRPSPRIADKKRPGIAQVISRPAVKAPPRVLHAQAPSGS